MGETANADTLKFIFQFPDLLKLSQEIQNVHKAAKVKWVFIFKMIFQMLADL